MISDFISQVNPSIRKRSGSVFYSGRRAFGQPSDIYILGLNPGGCPCDQAKDTIDRDLEAITGQDREYWSAYRDDRWTGEPGESVMQLRVRYLLKQLGLNPREVPASNVVFVRSRRERDLRREKSALLSSCWPFHEAVIRQLGIRNILCFGGTAGLWVREKLGAHRELIDHFQEENRRRWTSKAHCTADGLCVFTLTHPSIAKWDAAATDPTGFVKEVINRQRPMSA